MSGKSFIGLALAAACWSASAPAPGADFDGSKALTCATVEAHDCSAGETCRRGLAESVGAPQFMRIDFSKKTIAGPKRTTAIVSLTKAEQQLLLQGTELGYAWSIVLDTEDGSMAATLANRDGVVALFGACTPSPA